MKIKNGHKRKKGLIKKAENHLSPLLKDDKTEFLKSELTMSDIDWINGLLLDFFNEISIKHNNKYQGMLCPSKSVAKWFKDLGFVVVPQNSIKNYSSNRYWIGFDVPATEMVEKDEM